MKRKRYASVNWFLRRAAQEQVGLVAQPGYVWLSMTSRGPIEWLAREIVDTKRCALARRLKRIRKGDLKAMKRELGK